LEWAARWELHKNNSGKRTRPEGTDGQADPDVLTAEEFCALLAELQTEPYRTKVILAGCSDSRA